MGLHIASDWSERHAAYAAGLGTFGLTRALITEKGIAGRFGSLLISLKLEPDERPYTGLQDYCIRCGACIKRCPVHAISLERGKDQFLCALRVVPSKKITKPCYGCGKCQVEANCPIKIAKVVDGKVVIDPAQCNHCGRCKGKCLFDAITYTDGYKVSSSSRQKGRARNFLRSWLLSTNWRT